jgi:hypothetical protein
MALTPTTQSLNTVSTPIYLSTRVAQLITATLSRGQRILSLAGEVNNIITQLRTYQ